jgi:hypothetical protein
LEFAGVCFIGDRGVVKERRLKVTGIIITRVQISCLTVFRALKTLDISRLGAWTHSRASAQAEVSASSGIVTLLSELPGHILLEINIAPFGPFSAVQ